MSGIFITVEGIDGSGKSTQSERIAEWLEKRTGLKTIKTFEPGGWAEGKKLREFILNSKNFCAMSELLLFLADRAEHVNKVIIPELEANHNVICERYNESTLAYQSGGHEVEFVLINELIKACRFPEPDVKILFDINPEIAFKRVRSRNSNNNDKFEAEGLLFMKKVADFYNFLAEKQPEKFIKISCDNLNENEVFHAVTEKLEALI